MRHCRRSLSPSRQCGRRRRSYGRRSPRAPLRLKLQASFSSFDGVRENVYPGLIASKTSTQREKERREDTAGGGVASGVGARFRRRDGGGAQGHDLALEFQEGAVEAPEVCTFTDSTAPEQWQNLD